MKHLILIWSLLLSQIVFAASPVGMQGQSQTAIQYPVTHQVPYNQVTATAGGNALIETGNGNMLANPDFEAPTLVGWTCAVGTCTVTNTAGEFSSGKQALKMAVTTSQTLSVYQQINTPSGIIKQGEAFFLYRIPASITNFIVKITVDGVLQTTVPSSALINDDTFRPYPLGVTYGSSNVKIEFSTNGNASANANIFVDYVVLKTGISFGSLSVDTDWVSCTFSTLAWGGFSTNITNNSLQCRRNGTMLEMRGRFTTGTIAATPVQIPLPSNYGSIQIASNVGTNELSGLMMRGVGGSTNALLSFILNPLTSYVQLGGAIASSTGNPTTPQNGNGLFGSAEAEEITYLRVPIQGWSSSTSTYSQPSFNVRLAGEIIPMAGSTCPSGTLLADGTAVSRTTYSELFSKLNTLYGVGDGSTTFNLPNLKGVFLKGAGSQTISGIVQSGTLGTTENDQMQGHKHGITVGTPASTGPTVARTLTAVAVTSVNEVSGSNPSFEITGATTDGTNGTPRSGTVTRPANVSVNYCVLTNSVNTIMGSFSGYASTPGVSGSNNANVDHFAFTYAANSSLNSVCSSGNCYLDQLGCPGGTTDQTCAVKKVVYVDSSNNTVYLNKTYTKLKCIGNYRDANGASVSYNPMTCANCSTFISQSVEGWGGVAGYLNNYGNVMCTGTY